eukprot:scaffold1390_cov249-Pinguiococcus_pyrenoidosus.AAC.13
MSSRPGQPWAGASKARVVSDRREMHEHASKPFSFERMGPPVRADVALVEDQITGLHRDIVRVPLVIVDLQRPGFDRLLGNVDDRRRHQREAIDVGSQNGALGVHSDAVEGGAFQLLTCPLLENGLDPIPDGIL